MAFGSRFDKPKPNGAASNSVIHITPSVIEHPKQTPSTEASKSEQTHEEHAENFFIVV